MASHPEAQSRAQAEIDEICGRVQTPQPAQLGSLTYLHAVLKEVLRYAPIGNLGTVTFFRMNSMRLICHLPIRIALPHSVVEDDEYRGYRIPKGATIMGNVWYVDDPFSISTSFCYPCVVGQ